MENNGGVSSLFFNVSATQFQNYMIRSVREEQHKVSTRHNLAMKRHNHSDSEDAKSATSYYSFCHVFHTQWNQP